MTKQKLSFFQRNYRIGLFFFLLLISPSLIGSDFSSSLEGQAKKGVLDLRHWDFDKDGVIALEGEWEFYWQQLLTSEDFGKAVSPSKTGYIRVPSYWNYQEIDGQEFSAVGYATYRLIVLTNNERQKLTLNLGDAHSSIEVFVNGKKVSACGKAGDLAEVSIEKWQADTILDSFQGKKLEILVHVSNYGRARGGIQANMMLGTAENIKINWVKTIAFDLFLFGSIFIIGLYYLGFYALRRVDKTFLYFSVFCFLIAIRVLVMGEHFATLIFPGIELGNWLKIEYLSVFLAVPSFSRFISTLFPHDFSRLVRTSVDILCAVFAFFVIAFSEKVYIYTLRLFEILAVLVICYIAV
ncbi:7TM-DISM domain-containing protein, partial [bacterium]|nr:7TM-DISM domain-containing protein [bacterium]